MDSHLTVLRDLDEVKIADSVACDVEELSKYLPACNSIFNIVTQNIRSVYSNFDNLQLTLSQIPCEADVLVLTECRLNINKEIPPIKDYSTYFTTKNINQNDGVVVFIKNCHQFRVTEMNLLDASGLQLSNDVITILSIYRSPSNVNAENFINSLERHLDSIDLHKNIILIGDININLIVKLTEATYDRNNRLKYLEVLSSHGLLPGHYLPTRMSSCLDHVILKLDTHHNSPIVTVLNTSVTDHSMVLLCLVSKSLIKKTKVKFKTVVDYENISKTLICTDITRFNNYKDPNNLADAFINLIRSELHLNTKIKPISSCKRLIKPWMTTGVLRCIRLRNNMQLKVRSEPHNNMLKIIFKRYRNFCVNLINKSKRQYNRKKVEVSAKDSKKLWSTVNEITQYKPANTSSSILLLQSNSPLDSVNRVNNFFVNVGKSLCEEIALNFNPCRNTICNASCHVSSFVLLDTDPQEVNDVLMGLDSACASGWDEIPVKLLKSCKDFIVPVVVQLANLCFHSGLFPKALKRSVVTPIFKGGDNNDVNNYRPISVLTSISKIIEKLLNKRLLSYLTTYDILSTSQYGFRRGKSTQDAVIDMVTLITERVDNGDKCLTVFLDLKKAFDTVSTDILTKRLEDIGVRGIALSLFQNYLSERKQIVKIDKFKSSEEIITYGVPQGSVLGPTLFLVYINDLCRLGNSVGRVFCYADDTALVFSGRTWDAVKASAESGLAKVYTWLNTNLLTINTAKTNYICFAPSKRSQPSEEFFISLHACKDELYQMDCSCPRLLKVNFTKYLGVIVDQRLSWHSQIDLVIERIRKLKWIFKTLRHVMTSTLLNKIYVALVQSIITYCIPVWGGAAKCKMLDLERAQRLLLKIMYFKPFRFPTESLYKLCNLLSIRQLYILHTTLSLHKTLPYDPTRVARRRKDIVTQSQLRRTDFARRQYPSLSVFIYNSINRKLDNNIYPKLKFNCKKSLIEWLSTLNYEETERILKRII